jgi:hypothetical protein
MRHVEYHAAYWAIAYMAATAYHDLTTILGVPEAVFCALLVPLLGLFINNIILQGPQLEPWPRMYYVAFSILVVSLGPLSQYFSVPGVKMMGPNRFIHSCLAFEVIGCLEAIRQNVSEARYSCFIHITASF